MILEREQTLEVVRRDEDVDIWQRRVHAAGEGLVVLHSEQRIEPDHAPNLALHTGQLCSEKTRFARVPAVAQHEKESIARAQLSAMELVEFAQRSANAG